MFILFSSNFFCYTVYFYLTYRYKYIEIRDYNQSFCHLLQVKPAGVRRDGARAMRRRRRTRTRLRPRLPLPLTPHTKSRASGSVRTILMLPGIGFEILLRFQYFCKILSRRFFYIEMSFGLQVA